MIFAGNYMLDHQAMYTMGDYMMDNEGDSNSRIIKVKPLREKMKDIIGYQYLHGTNETVGGFQIQGTISKNSKGDTIYDLTYTWNDIIDPNFMYDSDSKKAEFAKSIPGANPTDYYLQISWYDKTTIRQNPSFWNRSGGWLSK